MGSSVGSGSEIDRFTGVWRATSKGGDEKVRALGGTKKGNGLRAVDVLITVAVVGTILGGLFVLWS